MVLRGLVLQHGVAAAAGGGRPGRLRAPAEQGELALRVRDTLLTLFERPFIASGQPDLLQQVDGTCTMQAEGSIQRSLANTDPATSSMAGLPWQASLRLPVVSDLPVSHSATQRRSATSSASVWSICFGQAL